MTLARINRALGKLREAHAAGGTIYTLLGSGKLREWPPGEPFEPMMIVFRSSRRTIARWLDRVTWEIGPSRADGWIGTFNIDRLDGDITVFVGWFQDPKPMHGPVMSFGAAFLDYESWYLQQVRAMFEAEASQLIRDSYPETL